MHNFDSWASKNVLDRLSLEYTTSLESFDSMVNYCVQHIQIALWRHQMETSSASLNLRAGNSPVTGEFPAQRPVTQSFDVSFDLCLNKQLSKQSWGWWFWDAIVLIMTSS